jgi:hypothetical protein
VPYDLDMPADVESYLASLPLSAAGKRAVARALEYLGDVSDTHRTDPANRVAPGHPCFRYQHLFAEPAPEGDGHYHAIEFVVDDSGAAAGVLRIRFAEHTRGAPMP